MRSKLEEALGTLQDRLLDVDEVAERLGVEPSTVRHYIRTKQLPAIRLGNQYRVSEKDLQRFLDERRTVDDSPDTR
jgi:excisionase family DNA binding protein